MDFSEIDAELVATLALLMLIGMGPKVAFVPFLERTKAMSPEQQREVGRHMVKVAVITALVLFATGALLMKLLHITPGGVAIGGGIVLGLMALRMASGPGGEPHETLEVAPDTRTIAVYPLAIPYLLNPVGMTVLIVASGSVDSVAGAGLVVGLILAVGALDWFYFTNMQVISKRVNPATLVISEVVFGILLTALAVELIVHGLTAMGLLAAAGH